jgi:hypothetical protein
MATTIGQLETLARLRLNEPVARFWSQNELTEIIASAIRDLWRDIADLKAEHFMTVASVTLAANSSTMTGVPSDLHKVILIEPSDTSQDSSNVGLTFKPAEYQSDEFIGARSKDPVDPNNEKIFYCITQAGTPVGAPTIRVAPQVTADVTVSLAYVPSVGTLTSSSNNPIPGESDNAIVAWTVAFARAKERDDLGPDPNWMAVYATEKAHLLQSLGLRQYQEEAYVPAIFGDYW